MVNRTLLILSGALSALSLGACSTAYQPYKGEMTSTGGYFDYSAGKPDEYFVEIEINQFTSTETGDQYLLRRSQELCTERGFEHFTVLGQEPGRPVYPNFRKSVMRIRCIR